MGLPDAAGIIQRVVAVTEQSCTQESKRTEQNPGIRSRVSKQVVNSDSIQSKWVQAGSRMGTPGNNDYGIINRWSRAGKKTSIRKFSSNSMTPWTQPALCQQSRLVAVVRKQQVHLDFLHVRFVSPLGPGIYQWYESKPIPLVVLHAVFQNTTIQ